MLRRVCVVGFIWVSAVAADKDDQKATKMYDTMGKFKLTQLCMASAASVHALAGGF